MPTGFYQRKPFTEEHKRKIGLANAKALKGRKVSLEVREKLKGRIPWNKGTLGVMKAWNKGLKTGLTRQQKKEKLAGREKPKDCEICGGGGKICFDHNHVTGKFRGWICERCNFSIGHARDNAELLEAMASYLRRMDVEQRYSR